MSYSYKNLIGEQITVECLSCSISEKKINVIGEVLYTKYFSVHQDQEIPIPGFFIISSKRHITSISQFTNEEETDFISVLKKVRLAMKDVLNIEEVMILQKESSQRHFHVWLFPRYNWMLDVQEYGTTTASITPIIKFAKENLKTAENVQKIKNDAYSVKKFLI